MNRTYGGVHAAHNRPATRPDPAHRQAAEPGDRWSARLRVHRRAGGAGLARTGWSRVRAEGRWLVHPRGRRRRVHVASAAHRRAVSGLFCPRAARLASPVASRASGPAGARWLLPRDDAAQRRLLPGWLWLAAVCLGWLFARMLGATFGAWPMPELRPSISSRWLGLVMVVLLLVRIGSVAGGTSWMSGRRARSERGVFCTDCTCTERCPGRAPAGSGSTARTPTGPSPTTRTSRSRPSSRRRRPGRDAVAGGVLRRADACRTICAGRRLGGLPLALAFVFAYLLYPFTDLALMAETNDALIAALCVWTIVAAQRPVTRGLLIAAAVMTKFVPVLLALQFLDVRRGRSRYVLTLVAALGGMLAWPLIDSGAAQFLGSTSATADTARRRLAVQHLDVHAAGGDRGQADTRRRTGAARALANIASSRAGRSAARRSRRSTPHRAQLLLGYWFYNYLIWFYPLFLVAVIQPPREHRDAKTLTNNTGSVGAVCPWRRPRMPHTSNKCTAPVFQASINRRVPSSGRASRQTLPRYSEDRLIGNDGARQSPAVAGKRGTAYGCPRPTTPTGWATALQPPCRLIS